MSDDLQELRDIVKKLKQIGEEQNALPTQLLSEILRTLKNVMEGLNKIGPLNLEMLNLLRAFLEANAEDKKIIMALAQWVSPTKGST